MELDYAFFADSAAAPDQKLYVLGGGFSTIQLPSLPGRVTFAVCAGFRFTAADAGRSYGVELRFVDEKDRLVIPPVTLSFQTPAAVPTPDFEATIPTISYLTPTFGEPGRYAAEYWMGDRVLARVRLSVAEHTPGTPAPVTTPLN